MKKIIGIIIVILLIPFFIFVISDIDKIPIYPETDFTLSKITQISSIDLIDSPTLPKLPNGVGDRWVNDKVEKRVGKWIPSIDDYWIIQTTLDDVVQVSINNNHPLSNTTTAYNDSLSNLLPYRDIMSSEFNDEGYRFVASSSTPTGNRLYLKVKWNNINANSSDSDTYINNAIREYLIDNNFIIYYQLATPTIETAPPLPTHIDTYTEGTIIVDNGVIDYTLEDNNKARINYIEGNITTVVDNEFVISKPTKIVSASNNLYNYDINTLPPYFEYGALSDDTYTNLEQLIIENNGNKIKLFINDEIQPILYDIIQEDNTISITNGIDECITIYSDNTYTSTNSLLENTTYKVEGKEIIEYIDGKFNNNVLAFLWIIPILLVGGLMYFLIGKRKGD